MSDKEEIKTRDLLKKYGFRFKKKWGQNFIRDKNLLRRMVSAAQIEPGDQVVEIGAGAGTLTKILAEAGARVMAIEIDEALIPILQEQLQGLDVIIIQGDVLKIDLDKLTKEHNINCEYKVVANLPYYITTPILMNFLEKEYNIERMVIMVQWEVAERLTARAGSKAYGAITLAVQYYTEPQILFKAARRLFTPPPEVDSAVLCLKRRKKPPVEVKDKQLLFRIIKAAFGQRRKTLLNALSSVFPGPGKEHLPFILEKAGIDGRMRGENLALYEYASIANRWQEWLDEQQPK